MKQIIQPSLWFDDKCEEAMNFYISVFPGSKISSIEYYPKNAADPHLKGMDGKVLHGEFELCGRQFVALDGGPVFTFNPSKSFIVNCDTAAEVDAIWEKLSDDGNVLMELGEYPFSPHYGWIQDKYGLSWQLLQGKPDGDKRPGIVPSIMFIHANAGQAEAARDFYLSVFKPSQAGNLWPYEPGTAPDDVSKVAYEDFQLLGEWFAAMDAGRDMHDFDLNEAVSFVINCKDQTEIDYYWGKLSDVPEAEQCGWCKDKFGISWQIIPENMGELVSTPAAMEAMMKMHKIDIAALENAA
ncbi:MAG TPA: VOC family protein [Candidatus Saccharimonadales bacterium]|nr:VOC family protein [Candidatus Saccharimonadales bacterium]